jgi:hypothetical protein
MKRIVLTALLTGLSLLLLACNGEGPGSSDSAHAQEMPEVSQAEQFVDYIGSHTAGIVRRDDTIQITFVDIPEGVGEAELRKLVSFEPQIKGQAELREGRSLLIHPKEPLPSGTVFQGRVDLGAIYEVPEELEEYLFAFSTLKQDFEAEFTGSSYAETLELRGIIRTADSAGPEQVEKALRVESSYEEISWEHDADGRVHRFTIHGIPREGSDRRSRVTVKGGNFGVSRSEELEFTVAGTQDFAFLGYTVLGSQEGGIAFDFSMPLDSEQELTGLVRIGEREDLPAVIEGSRLILYPPRGYRRDRQATIFPGLTNTAGTSLEEKVSFTIPARIEKPQIKLEIPGGILPGTDEHRIPIRTVSLKSIDVEVVRIFTDNMVQFLQNNRDVTGTRNIKAVGRPVARTTISLEGREANLYEWNRFDLDLSRILEREPGALYQILLTMRPSGSLYPCAAEGEQPEIPFPRSNWDSGGYRTRWDNFYQYYNWRDRNDPCTPSYYLRRQESINVLASDLGVIAKKADASGVHAYVRNLRTTAAEADATVRLYNYQQQPLAEAVTDATGYAYLPTDATPFALGVEKEGMRSWMRIDDGASLALGDFDVDGVKAEKGLKGFIYGERGVWRPGDDIYLNFILEDELKSLPQEHPVTFELLDPRGRTVDRQTRRESIGPIYPFHTSTDPEAPTGKWTARVQVGGESFERTVKVETVKPNRLKVNLKLPGRRITWEDRRQLRATLAAEWLHGATASNLDAEVELSSHSISLEFSGYPAYHFDDPAKDYYQSPRTVFDGSLNAEGEASFPIPLSNKPELSGAVQLEFTSKVYENAGDFSFNKESAPYYPYRSYVGIDPPAGDARRGMLQTDTEHTIRIASLDAHGAPVAREGVELELYKLSWRWWWDKSDDDIGRYLSSGHRNRVLRGTADTDAEGRGEWTMQVEHPEWGRYYLRATDPVSGHTAGKVIYIDWPGWAGAPRRGDAGASMLSFYTDSREYEVGDTAELSIPSESGGGILVSLENNTGVINSWWSAATDGTTTVRFPVTEEMAPTTYIHATLVQPHGETANDRPLRMYGVVPVSVVDPSTRLNPRISMPEVFTPEEEVTIAVSEAEGRAMSYTLAVVDQGLTDLTNFTVPDPWNAFNAKEALGVKSWDIYDDVIGSFGGSFGSLLAVGGGGEKRPTPPDKPNRFKPVVEFFGPFSLAAGEKAEHSFTMPLYIGAVKVMAVGATEEAWGSVEEQVPVRKELMILGSFPRRIAPGERSALPVNIFAMEDGIGTVEVSVRSSEGLELEGPASKRLSFQEAGDGYLYFDLRAAKTTGPAKIVIDARGGGVTTSYEIELEIMAVNPEVTRVEDTVVAPGESWRVDSSSFGLPGSFSRSLEASWAPPLDLRRRLDYLIGYPHGCLEQTVSRAFPQLYLEALTELDTEQQRETERNVTAAVEKALRLQHTDGGFLYWPGRSSPDPWVSSYAGHFLLEARTRGYHVDQAAIDSWLRFQRNAARGWEEDKHEIAIQSYRLLTLALAGEAEIGAMNRLAESRYASGYTLFQLAAAYAAAGRSDLARQLERRASLDWEEHESGRNTYGSLLRDKAMALLAHLELESNYERFRLAEEIAAGLSDDRWLSTQTTAFALMAMARHLGHIDNSEPIELSWSFAGGAERQEESEARYLMRELPDGDGRLEVKNRMHRPLYLQLITTGIPETRELPAEERGLSMKVEYRPEDSVPGFDPDELRQGVSFAAVVEISNESSRDVENLVLSQIFPSGWEILNPRLLGEGMAERDADTHRPNYRDVRDDRVYTYFDLMRGETKRFKVLLNAAYAGEYTLPMVDCQAMYDNRIYARKPGGRVRVVR